MLETLPLCPICNHSEAKAFTEAKDFTVSQETFKIVQCENCGFCYTNPRPDAKSIGKYYDSEAYISHSNTKQGLTSRLYQWVRQRALQEKSQLVARLSEFHPKKQMKILDYGCGTGEFLNTCQKEGWRIDGIEPNQSARKQAEDLTGLYIQDDLFIKHFEPQSYSVITLWHVLEHVHQLQATLDTLKSLLTPDGVLVLALPNRQTWEAQKFGNYWAAYDVPRHLYHFAPSDVANLAAKHGLMIEETLPMYYDAYYVSLLSEKYKSQKTNFLKGFWLGWQSNQKAKKTKQYSSLIYVLKNKV
jgi:2-polyprenyl-3-methyl-5-hydroxy-6-metoxy-1,4-benzoquinol methylase